jgi:hypothetical protein
VTAISASSLVCERARVSSAKQLIPSHGRLHQYARARALLQLTEFTSIAPGRFVLVRLDERGGADEPSPWAMMRLPARGGTADKIYLDVFTGPNDLTASAAPQSAMPIPAAREQASAWFLADGEHRIGRANNNHTRIEVRSISRWHASHRAADVHLDLTPHAAISCNGMPLELGRAHAVRSGDILKLADVEFLLLSTKVFAEELPALIGDR